MDKEYYKELSSKAADGDAKSFSKLYETLYRNMYYTAFYTLADEKDAIDAVIGTARDGFNTINRLRTSEAFEIFMMKTLCARIKTRCREYGDDIELEGDEQPEIKKKLFELNHTDRLITVLYVCGRTKTPVISAYTGMLKSNVRKRLLNALNELDLDPYLIYKTF